MTLRSKSLVALACLGLVAMFGTAAAQTGSSAAPTGGGGAGTKIDVEAGSSMTPAEQTAQMETNVKRMEASAKRVRHLLDEARRNKDVVKATCLSDKLAQIEVAIKSIRERAASHKAAVARGDRDVHNHEFRVGVNLRKRSDQLDAEANQCIGEELGFPGETKTTYSVDPNIAPEDPGTGGDPGIVTYVPPLPASPIN